MIRRILILVAVMLGGVAVAQDTMPPRHPQIQGLQQRRDWRTRLNQVGQLIKLGSQGRAATMLEEMEKVGAPRVETIPAWVALAASLDDHQTVADLCEEGLALQPRSPRLLRSYAMALMALDRLDEADGALARLLAGSPNKTNVVIQAVDLWREGGHPERGLALCDSVREAADGAPLLRRSRAACLFDLERVEEAVDEVVGELDENPLNLRILRREVLPLLGDRSLVERAVDALDRDDLTTAPILLRADLMLRLGRDEESAALVDPLQADTPGVGSLLRLVATLSREAPLIEDAEVRRATVSWLLSVLDSLAVSPAVDAGRRPQILDMLAGAAERALELGLLDHDPERAVARLEAVLDRVRTGSPGSSRLYSAQILLARYTRDVQGRPTEAADRLARLLTNLDLPLRGVALCRLELGLSHLAECDTTRARIVLRRLGRSSDFPEAAGPAHFELARLDLAQGHWESARDRLAAVALDDPRADHANDALDLALLLAEELDGTGEGPLLTAYGAAVAADLCRDQDGRRAALERLLEAADPAVPSELADRARLELGALEAAGGRHDRAADLAATVASDHPDGAQAPRALMLLGTWRSEAGDPEAARRAWERLVIQYPDDLAAEDARILLRELP